MYLVVQWRQDYYMYGVYFFDAMVFDLLILFTLKATNASH